MEATLLLANSAEATPGGTVSALGIGWSVTSTPTPPAAIIILIQVPWDRTNEPHSFTLALVDSDGGPVNNSQSSIGEAAPVVIQADFEVGRPPGIPRGTSIDQIFSLNIASGLAVSPGERYRWLLNIDGQEAASVGFFVRPNAPAAAAAPQP